jgi:hypothetical protein
LPCEAPAGGAAVVAAKGLSMLREDAKRRQAATQAKPGEQVGKVSADLRGPQVSADLREGSGAAGKSTEHAAQMLNVSRGSVENAAKVRRTLRPRGE